MALTLTNIVLNFYYCFNSLLTETGYEGEKAGERWQDQADWRTDGHRAPSAVQVQNGRRQNGQLAHRPQVLWSRTVRHRKVCCSSCLLLLQYFCCLIKFCSFYFRYNIQKKKLKANVYMSILFYNNLLLYVINFFFSF